jgi:hypothetical protein
LRHYVGAQNILDFLDWGVQLVIDFCTDSLTLLNALLHLGGKMGEDQ